jgi:hypothetical protein
LYGLRADHGGDEYPLEIELRLGAEHLSGSRVFGQKAAVDDSSRFARAWRAPRPSAVVALGCQLDVDPSGHASDNATNVGGKDFLNGSSLPRWLSDGVTIR